MRYFSRVIASTPVLPLVLVAGLIGACNPRPEQVAEHLKRGDAALAEGKYPQAIAAYNHARELAPTDPEVQRAQMRARVSAIAESPGRLSAEGLEDARYEAQLLLDTDKPREAIYQCALANVLARQGEVEGAKARFADALKVDPSSPLAHLGLGLLQMGRRETLPQAKTELEAALRAKPDLGPALIALGQIKLSEGDLVGAADKLDTAIRASDDYAARMTLGNVRVQQQKPLDAIEHFQRAAQLDPRSAEALSALGQAQLAAGKAEEAERTLRGALQLRQDPAAALALAFSLARQRKPEQALDVFRQVLAQDPSTPMALYGAGMAAEELGKGEQAAELYRRVLAATVEGQKKQMFADVRQDAQNRMTALTTASAAAAGSGAPLAGAPPKKKN